MESMIDLKANIICKYGGLCKIMYPIVFAHISIPEIVSQIYICQYSVMWTLKYHPECPTF